MNETEEFNREQAKIFGFADSDDIEFMLEYEDFEAWLNKRESARKQKRAKTSIFHILEKVKNTYVGMGGYLSLNNLKELKRELQDNDKSPNYINTILSALHNYAEFLSEKYNNTFIRQVIQVPRLSVQPRQYIDHVISRADYDFMVAESKKLSTPNIYLGIRIMGTTGVRLCELLQIKVEHIKTGYIDVLGKGAKRRRIYFPKRVREELIDYLSTLNGGDSGYVLRYWSVKRGKQTGAYEKNTREINGFRDTQIFTRAFQGQLRRFGLKLGLDEGELHPHGFRHFFAKEFLRHRMDISLLADLLGHSSLDITRIYLKMTSREQAEIVDEVVEW